MMTVYDETMTKQMTKQVSKITNAWID